MRTSHCNDVHSRSADITIPEVEPVRKLFNVIRMLIRQCLKYCYIKMYSSYPVCLDTSFRWVSEIEYLLYFSALLCFCSTEHGIDGETIDVVDYVFLKAMEHAKL